MLDKLINNFAKWLNGEGNQADLIISSRIRLARNLNKIPFPNKANPDDLQKVIDAIKEKFRVVSHLEKAMYIDMLDLSELDRQFLMERRLISHDFVGTKNPAAIIVNPDETICIMINEEDHFRLQSIQSGLEINKAWQAMSDIEDELASIIDFAYSEQFGYLTACPTNTGTGMRVSIFIHLAGLDLVGDLQKIIKEKVPSEITIRGFYGEGTQAFGNIFQISNQLTLGRTENAIIERLINVAMTFIEMEQDARERLLKKGRIKLEDKIHRSVGILKFAKIINSVEFINLLSMLRLGIYLKLTDGVSFKTLNELMVLGQPAHLQKFYNKKLSSEKRDLLRAKLIRNRLKF
jgi:protein arginine kinase